MQRSAPRWMMLRFELTCASANLCGLRIKTLNGEKCSEHLDMCNPLWLLCAVCLSVREKLGFLDPAVTANASMSSSPKDSARCSCQNEPFSHAKQWQQMSKCREGVASTFPTRQAFQVTTPTMMSYEANKIFPSAAKLTFSRSPFTLAASAILLPSSQSGVIIVQCGLSNKEIAVHAVWFLESWE